MSEMTQEACACTVEQGVSRRSFVKAGVIAGAAAGALGIAGCKKDPEPTPTPEPGPAPKPAPASDPFEGCQEFYATCPPECQHHNLKALVKDGKIVKVECGVNNESKPCMMGYARVEWNNSPKRLTKPMLRTGEKGSGQFKEISWDEALTLWAEKLQDAINTVGNKGIVADSHAGNFNALVGICQAAFTTRIGGAVSLTGSLCCAGMNVTTTPVFGKRFYDCRNQVENASYILVRGTNPAVGKNGYLPRFLKCMENGGRVVTIDPVKSECASKSNDWVAIRPATDTALAMGMLKIIVDEKMTNEAFMKAHTTLPCLVKGNKNVMLDAEDKTSFAVVDAKTGEIVRHDKEGVDPLLTLAGTKFANEYSTVYELVVAELQPWTPEAVEAETGVPAAKVTELARDYGKAERAMIVQNMGGFMRVSWGAYACAAMNDLALFTGQIGGIGNGVSDAGGINNIVKLSSMITNPKVEGVPSFPRVKFWEKVLNEDPVEYKVFISSRESPMTQWPNTGKVKEMLKKIPFVVVIDSMMTSTALYADLVLPCACVFETEDILCNARSHVIQLSEKAVEAPGEAHDDLWIFTQIAKKMGVGEDLDHPNEYFIRKGLEGTGYTYEQLKKEHAIDAYPADFIPYKGGKFETASGKAEVFQESWLAKGPKAVVTYCRGAETVGGESGLDAKYPLACVQRKLNRTVHSTFGALDLINNNTRNYACIMIHTADAAARGIKDGDKIVAFNDRGEHHARAIVTDGIMKGVVCAENGWWEQQGGSSSYITNDAVGFLAGEHCCNETLVEIRKEA